MLNDYLQQLSQNTGFDFVSIVLWLKFVSGAISAILFAGIVIIVRKTMRLANPIQKIEENILQLGKIPKSIFEEHSQSWEAVLVKINSPNSSDWKVAIIQSDSILDDILKRSGYVGDTMADRLKQIDASRLAVIQDIWDAHKLRNVIVHDLEREVLRADIVRAFEAYKKAFKEWEFIE